MPDQHVLYLGVQNLAPPIGASWIWQFNTAVRANVTEVEEPKSNP